MANIISSIKRDKQSKKRKKINVSCRSIIRTFIKKTNKAILLKNKSLANDNFFKLQKIIDRQASKNIIHKNKAARYKSRIYKKIISI